MTRPTLVILAAGAGRRFGGLKQLDPLGPRGQALLDYALFDAARTGFGQAVLVVRPDLEAAFRAHFQATRAGLPLTYAYQTLSVDEFGGSPDVERARPWGTGHALLAAASRLGGPFAVINADDFYGEAAFRSAANHLAHGSGSALVTYRLDRTLFSDGGVSRGLCRVSDAGLLLSVEELTGVSRTPEGALGTRGDGSLVALSGGEPVSMNLWAFDASILGYLDRGFRSFLSTEPGGEAEFQLPDVVGAGLSAGAFIIRALPTDAETFGVTFAEDREWVRGRLAALTTEGDYPATLSSTSTPGGSGSRSVPGQTTEA